MGLKSKEYITIERLNVLMSISLSTTMNRPCNIMIMDQKITVQFAATKSVSHGNRMKNWMPKTQHTKLEKMTM